MSFSVVHPCPKINHPQYDRENMFFFCVAIPKWKVYCWAYHISLAFESCKEKTVFGNVSYLGGKTHGSLEQHHVKRCVFFWSVMFAKLVPMFWLTWWFECIFGSFEFWVFHCVITLNLCIIQAYTCVCVRARVCELVCLYVCMSVGSLLPWHSDLFLCVCACACVSVCAKFQKVIP